MTLDESYVTDVMTYDNLVYPASEQILNNSYGTPAGWFDVSTGGIFGGNVQILGDMTIAPYWKTYGIIITST